MVQVRSDYPRTDTGQVDVERWLDELAARHALTDRNTLSRACHLSQAAEAVAIVSDKIWSPHTSSFLTGLEMADILADLRMDQDSLVAAILYRAVREEKLPLVAVREQFGDAIANLIEGVLRMAAISMAAEDAGEPVFGRPQTQSDQIRKMLVTLIDDVRVALIKLAERTCAIRAVKNNPAKRERVAREVANVYAPLAHRLGIGHIKWELEDLSFRYLQPDAYKKIASMLDEKRRDRDRFISDVTAQLRDALQAEQIEAEVYGRAKHIYSIWRKMRRKNIRFSEVYDIRAVRVLVNDIKSCYAALGIVHSLWPNIPHEFDDYIANPKDNGYRSLHTAVYGPEGKVLEVQIRTRSMHDEAEYGVCAHWQYKGVDANERNAFYERKVSWLRQVLEWHEEMGGVEDWASEFGSDATHERIYVFTPDGHVVDLAKGATPLDFAYAVHTDVGHRCRGAKVNGRIVALTTALQTGDQVEVITAKESRPSRDWLRNSLGYLKTSRAKAKVRHWFRQQDREQHIAIGRAILEKEFNRLSLTSLDYKTLASKMKYQTVDDLFAALGAGDQRVGPVVHAAHAMTDIPGAEQFELTLPADTPAPVAESGFLFSGVGNLLAQTAQCCMPLPGDPVRGYITQGRGVSVHRQDCPNLLQLQSNEPERIIEVDWGGQVRATYPVDIEIEAFDRSGLLRDITTLLANERVNLLGTHTWSDRQHNLAHLQLTLEVHDLESLSVLLARISNLPNIVRVARRRSK
ncbi:MAG: GTP diphosphokinase [Gammaproteobacteria bacterium]|nr:MAG: GTP diphosphokinase [Gammaproteobacteria bacterium]